MENEDLADICDKLFYNDEGALKGSVGIKNLADILALSDSEFENHIDEF